MTVQHFQVIKHNGGCVCICVKDVIQKLKKIQNLDRLESLSVYDTE